MDTGQFMFQLILELWRLNVISHSDDVYKQADKIFYVSLVMTTLAVGAFTAFIHSL